MRKVWIEVALNGAWSRALQPGIPATVAAIIAEGVACARAGAAIVHTHAYTDGGAQTFDWQVYARIIEGIRAEVDVPVYPSYPAIPNTAIGGEAAQRFAHIEALAARGLLEFCRDRSGQRQFHPGRHAGGGQARLHLPEPRSPCPPRARFAARNGFHPAFAIYEPGFTRAGAALARAAGVKPPVYRFMFSEKFAFGFPPKPYALAAHLRLARGGSGGRTVDDRRGCPPMSVR